MSDQVKIGELITGDANRDAIHVAVAPVTANEKLKPGQHVGIVSGDRVGLIRTSCIGIVDPFLAKPVKEGERFYLFLYPNTVTGMRHHWSHPAFNEATTTDSSESRRFIENTADELGFSYQEMMDIADGYSLCGYYRNMGDNEGFGDHIDWDQFWAHYTALTGRIPRYNGVPFSCAC